MAAPILSQSIVFWISKKAQSCTKVSNNCAIWFVSKISSVESDFKQKCQTFHFSSFSVLRIHVIIKCLSVLDFLVHTTQFEEIILGFRKLQHFLYFLRDFRPTINSLINRIIGNDVFIIKAQE